MVGGIVAAVLAPVVLMEHVARAAARPANVDGGVAVVLPHLLVRAARGQHAPAALKAALGNACGDPVAKSSLLLQGAPSHPVHTCRIDK